MARILGLDRQSEKVVRVDLVAERTGGAVAGRLPAEGPAAVGSRAVADDEAAHLVRVLGPSVVDQGLHDVRAELDGRRARARLFSLGHVGPDGAESASRRSAANARGS